MARPVKNYCDYFTHDRDMRNHRKIKALRTKFGIAGYGIWNMLLEYLTGIDGNEFEYSEVEMELMGGDFGVSVTEISDVLNYCIKLELLFLKEGFVNSESLDERLNPVYEKRTIAKSKSKKQLRSNGKFIHNNTDINGVSVTEMPESKVKYSKLNKSILIDDWEKEKRYFKNAEQYHYRLLTANSLSKDTYDSHVENFLTSLDLQEDYQEQSELKRYFKNWLTKLLKAKSNGTSDYEQETREKVNAFKPIIE